MTSGLCAAEYFGNFEDLLVEALRNKEAVAGRAAIAGDPCIPTVRLAPHLESTQA